jgi:uncharacterized protein YfaS (alpha-2-macroglobulin family)
MGLSHASGTAVRFTLLFAVVFLLTIISSIEIFKAANPNATMAATYSRGILRVTIPFHAASSGGGHLTVEILDPEDRVLGRSERDIEITNLKGYWEDSILIDKPLAIEDLIWQRVRYRFEFHDNQGSPLQATESIAKILRRPVMRIIGQQSYLSGGQAAVRLIVSDSNNEPLAGRGTVEIALLDGDKKSKVLFRGKLDGRGTTEAQFRIPGGLAGHYKLRYVADTAIGSTEFSQDVRLEDKVSILLTTEKPIYQPGQAIHVRALALDRVRHDAAVSRKLTFEIEDSRGNKVFKKAAQTDSFGVASAEFGLADEVNLGTYHLRALMGDPDAPSNAAELAFNVERYVLPRFKVAVEFAQDGARQKRGYQPGDHVTGTVHANYFFGKPVDNAEITVKISAMDVAVFEAASAEGKTDADGAYQFDLQLPRYFTGIPLNHTTARALIEASVKDSAGHSETRGEPITVSNAPLLVTAIPEGGTLVPNLENEVFILTSYPDGTPAKTELTVRAAENADQHVSSDDGGVAVVRIKAETANQTVQVEAADSEGNRAASAVELQTRQGDDQILLRTERAVYHVGDRILLKVFSTKRGAAYLDIVKDAQTIVTRDVDLDNGESELSLTVTPEMVGALDLNAYLFGRNAQAVGDHRLIFVQPFDELKIETVADAASYKPGSDARVRFRVTNSHGEGVHAALGLEVVDEAVFALAEKQPGFAKVFFYLEQEVMKPRYEIHSIDMPGIVEPGEESQAGRRDRAARALFSATEMVMPNKFETQYGRDLPMTKYWDYLQRYQAHFQAQVRELAAKLTKDYRENPKAGDPPEVFNMLSRTGGSEVFDAWGNRLTLERAQWNGSRNLYVVRSAGADHELNTGDDLQAYLVYQPKTVYGSSGPNASRVEVEIEHDRGAFNGRAEIVGTVTDSSGAVITGCAVELRRVSGGADLRRATTNAAGQFTFSAVPAGEYTVQVTATGFMSGAAEVKLRARDRAEFSAKLSVGQSSEMVEVEDSNMRVVMDAPAPQAAVGGVIGGVAGGIGAGQGGGVGGGVFRVGGGAVAKSLLVMNGQAGQFVADSKGLFHGLGGASPAAHVRSYFPEALYINPEIITDGEGRASILIPVADSITTWRMAMIASTQHGTLGTSTSSFKVFQDFFVDLDLPVTLTQGDQVSIPVAIYNYSGSSGKVNLRLKSEEWFSLVDDAADKSLAVDSSRVGGSQFTVRANRIGKFKLTVSAQMEGSAERADIVVREIEIVPNGREQNIVFNGRLESTVEHQLSFPSDAIPDATKIFVRLYPGPMSQVVEGMDSILHMPSGCFEQTSSSTYPNVLALDYMKRTKKLTPEIHAKAEGYIANGYQRLLTFEVPGGGFSWFGNAPANKILTAYGLMEFYDMSKIYDVDARLISRTQQWLASQQQKDGSWKPDAQFINEGATNRYNSDVLRITAYIAWALKDTEYQDGAVERAEHFVENHMDGKVDTYTLAVIANFAASYAVDREFMQHAIQLLLDARTEKDEQVWWTAEETGVYGQGASASIETTGLAVQALLQASEASGTAGKALNYVASKKDSYGTWGTTQATIMALRALLLATEKGAADTRGILTVLLNGKPAETLELTPENNDLLHQFVFKQIDARSPSTVEIQFAGKGGLAYQVVGNYFLPWDQKPTFEPLSIDVAYDRTHLAQDDLARAAATIKNNLDKTANMVMVDLGIPPGFDLLSEDLQDYQEKSAGKKSGHLSKFSLTATQAILYFDSFGAGETTSLKFRLRAKYPIRARTFESRVYEYYDPEISSIARPVQFEVAKR